MLPKPQDKHEEKALADIQQYGLHIMNVLEEGELPNFTYSIGLWHTYQHPEIIIIGLKHEISKWILNEIGRRISEQDDTFESGKNYDGLLEGFDCRFFDVPKGYYKEYVGWDIWLYGSADFPLRQCVWPSTNGHFPWEDGASEWFQGWQPVLKNIPIDES